MTRYLGATSHRVLRIAVLAIYWAVLIILTHIRIPEQVRQRHFPDKTLHVLGYIGLTVLLWGVVSPNQRVRWNRPAAWLVLAAILAYGTAEELSQQLTLDRATDPLDLLADLVGATISLLVLTIFEFWAATLVLLGLGIFVVTVLSRMDLAAVMPWGDLVFYLAGFGLFSWICGYPAKKDRPIKRWIRLTLPVSLLAVVSLSGLICHRPISIWQFVAGLLGITIGLGVSSLAHRGLDRDNQR